MITVPVSRRTSRLLSPVDVLVWVVLGCFGVVEGTPAQAQTASAIIPDQYVVVLRDAADARAHADAAVREHGVQLLHIYEHAYIAGPGVGIFSTYKDGSYATLSGTSMATPHVTGTVVLYVFQNGMASDAAGVAFIRQAITTPGGGYCVAQSDPRGFAGDPDAFPEPLVHVGPP